jgi:oligopeptide/dipeptide ABC transporter ATP-binding protein
MTDLLEVRDLRLAVGGRPDRVVVDGISFSVPAGGVVALVGESGCGKTVTALSVLRLNDAIQPLTGEILLEGEDILRCSPKRLREIRGGAVSMVFQEPMTSLNPVFTVGFQIIEALQAHQSLSRTEARREAIALLDRVGIPAAALRVDSYPHQLSGGMRQRVMIALALACRPKLLIADEPTTALDVTIQAQIIRLLRDLQRELGMAVLIITHDLGVVSDFADSTVVMYAGKVVESAPTGAMFAAPQHPYTGRLLASIPPVDHDVESLETIPGTVPSPAAMPWGCRFAPRCTLADAACHTLSPPLESRLAGRDVACWHPRGEAA